MERVEEMALSSRFHSVQYGQFKRSIYFKPHCMTLPVSLKCTRPPELGYEDIWLGCQLLPLNSVILYHIIYRPVVVYCGAPGNKVGNL